MGPPITTRVTTARLALRPPRTGDVAELRNALRKNAEHLRPWSHAQHADVTASLTAASQTIVRYRREWKRGEAYVLLVTKLAPGEPIIGRISLGGIMRGAFQNAYLGYWIDVDHQGQGLTTEAVGAAVAFAFGEEARLHRVQAAVMPRNAASVRVLEKLRFRREGFAERYLSIAGSWEDHLIFARTSDETR